MAGQRNALQYPSSEQTPKKRTRKATLKPAVSTRPARYRQAKIVASIETCNNIQVDSESEFSGPDNTETASVRGASKQRPRSRRIHDSTRVLNSSSSLQKDSAASAEGLESEGSRYNPSNDEESQSDEDDAGHARKRSKSDNGSSHARTNTSSTVGSRSDRHDPVENCPTRVHENHATAPRPVEHGRLLGENLRQDNQRKSNRPQEDGTTRPTQTPKKTSNRRLAAARDDAGEGPSRNTGADEEVQYLHTVARNVHQSGEPAGQARWTGLVSRPKGEAMTGDDGPPSNGTHDHNLAAPRAISDVGEESSREFRGHTVPFLLGSTLGSTAPTIGLGQFKLIDCRNEQNGLDGGSSKGKQPEVDASKKCQACFRFRRNCDQGKPSCGHCTLGNSKCIPQKTPKHVEQTIGAPIITEFSGSQLWEKCQRCAGLQKQCTFEEGEDDCQNCKKRGWKCLPLTSPKPKKKQPFRGRNQDPNTKCTACVKARSHCDGVKPKCGRCAKWKYKCYPPGAEPPKKVPKDEKCKRCRQLKLACSDSLPCPRCVKEGIECGMTAQEEEMQLKFLGEE
ncbi:uncharacterized protein LY89DRAFT_147227 [Mollisia scopiformis]|uniref:Zn(2)-C6 fungal-type domain-containing protein n=1 Tax=Mollisia scopiformis TaxID=149040 RepID=A0A194X1R9_MOLSC|nr:uncharacterized protein LY89DRAFT_147227 [Mollisia scopiformis]KUJ13787.1 hypothetical protein LY89DRAFT_147227 [Mollisia scopiformis]